MHSPIYKILMIPAMVIFTTAGLLAQKKYAGKDDHPEILKKQMAFVAWQGDDSAILRISGAPGQREKTVYIELNTKTGKQAPYTGDISRLYESQQRTVLLRQGNIFLREADGTTTQLTHTKEEEKTPVLSPNQEYVAFIRNNNLYTLRLADKKETQLSFDGSDVILNGYASLVYQEDVLTGGYCSFWWSPDSKTIAFYRFDDSQVPLTTLTDICPMPVQDGGRSFGPPDARTQEQIRYDYQHIKVETYRYPKAGDKNPEVRLGFVAPDGGAICWADFKEHGDGYFGDPFWRPDSKGLWVQWLNRGQDSLTIYNVSPASGKKETVYTETQKTWVMINEKDRIRFLPSGKGAILTSDKSGWDQLYFCDLNGKQISRITQGDFKVLDVLHIDEKSKVIYFSCFKDNVALTDLYKVDFDGKNQKRLTFGNYAHKVHISPGAKYFITNHFNPSSPERWALLNTDGKLITEIYDRKGADFDLYEKDLTQILTVKSEDGKFDIPMRVRWPADMKPGEKYPLTIHIYGGPNMMWLVNPQCVVSLASENEQKTISVFLEHRGSGLCGKIGADYLHRNLGFWELKDYTTCVQWLIENGQADPDKVFISGHSYGGYMTCYALTMGADVFKFGIAGAPVTDWLFYNTAYTERYMDSPDENPEGYKNSSVVLNADKFKGRLLIAHGMSDDNVHVQNTLQFVGELQRLGKQGFEMMLYPEDRHAMIGKHSNQYNQLRQQFLWRWVYHHPHTEAPAGNDEFRRTFY